MDFSELSKYSGLAVFSPNGLLLASTDQNKLIIRDSESLTVRHKFECLDGICTLAFSPDSTYIMAAQYKRKIVEVFSLRDPGWKCKIDEALAGLSAAQWARDSRHIITRTEFNLRLSIWSLVTKKVTYIKNPKIMPPISSFESLPGMVSVLSESSGSQANVRFSHSGNFMAVLTRVDCKDVLNIFSVAADLQAEGGGWNLLKQFHIETDDCVQIEWAPDDSAIICVDSPLNYNFVVYTPSGQKLMNHSAYEHALGIKTGGAAVKYSPSASFLAVGSYDSNVRLFNNATGKLMQTYTHTAASVNSLAAKNKASNLVIYVEKPVNPTHAVSRLVVNSQGEDKENNPLDDTSLNFEIANVSIMESNGPAVEDVDAALKNTLGVLKNLAKKKPGVPAAKGKPAAAKSTVVKKSSVSTAASSSSSAQLRRPSASDPERATITIPSKYSIDSFPLTLTNITPAVDKPDPKMGVGIVAWSSGDKYLLTRNDNTPNAVWVWDTQKLALSSILVQLDAVRCVAWDPKRLRFALCTNTSKLYLWSPEGCSIVDVPLTPGTLFQVRKLEWNSEGTCLLLMDKSNFCCCYLRE